MKRQRRLYVFDYLLTPDTRLKNGAVLCDGSHILAVGGISAFSMESDREIYTFQNAYATPGFIDTHIHGAGGFDSSSVLTSPKPLENMSSLLAQRGVTSFVPTVVAAEHHDMLENLNALADLIDHQALPGADVAGINIEGPFLNPMKRGAQPAEFIRPIDLGFARELIEAGRGHVKLMTFAPELENAIALVELLCERGVMPSMGHSLANDRDTLRSIDAGARRCTHLFNGMTTLHQRDMSLTSMALTDNRVTTELIIDGRHIHPRMVDLACRCKPSDKIVGISDCTMAAGMPNGEYRLGPSRIQVENGYSRTAQSILAGTTTMLDSGWHSLMSYGHLAETQAAGAVTWNAAVGIGLKDRGRLLPRLRADLAVFECGTNRPLLTIRRGEIVFSTGTNVQITEAD